MKLIFVILLASLCCAGVAAPGEYVITKYGAIGDGIADDSAAIQKALDAAKAGPSGSKAVVPPGKYRVMKPMKMQECLLEGLTAGAWPSDQGAMPTFIVDQTEGPCLTLGAAASVHGINFDYDYKNENERKFGPTILMSGNGISISNVRIHAPTQGIMADGKTNIGRLNIENVFIVAARDCGVYVTNTYDIPTLRNIEVWNTQGDALKSSIGFKFGKNDEIRITDCFAFSCKIGYLFLKDPEGSTWGGMTGCSADFSVEGVVVESAQSLRIVGGSLWAHGTSLRVDGPAKVLVTGTDLRSNGGPALVVKNCEGLSVNGCSFGKAGDSWPDVPFARISGGSNITINGCIFDEYSLGAVFEGSADNFIFSNNIFKPSPFVPITDNTPATANKSITGNLHKKTEASAK